MREIMARPRVVFCDFPLNFRFLKENNMYYYVHNKKNYLQVKKKKPDGPLGSCADLTFSQQSSGSKISWMLSFNM